MLLVQLIIGAGFLPIRNKVIKAKRKKSQKAIQELVSKTKIKYDNIFYCNNDFNGGFLF